ncbi:MAG: hypothetical protein AAGU11_18995, partial [Syntrophobacteraceae bacterium]
IRKIGDAESNVYAVAVSRDGKLALTAEHGGTYSLFALQKGRKIKSFLAYGDVRPHTASFSPDARYAVGGMSPIFLWDTATGAETKQIGRVPYNCYGAAISSDGKIAVISSRDKEGNNFITILDIFSGKTIKVIKTQQSNYFPTISSDNRFAATVGEGSYSARGETPYPALQSRIRVWDLTAGREMKDLRGFVPKNSTAEWDLKTGERERLSKQGSTRSEKCSNDLRFCLSTKDDGDTIEFVDKSDGRKTQMYKSSLAPDDGFDAGISSWEISPNGKYVAIGISNGNLRLFDVSSLKEIHSCKAHAGTVASLAFSSDSQFVLSGGGVSFGDSQIRKVESLTDVADIELEDSDRAVKVWELPDGREIKKLGRHGWSVDSIAIARDFRFALSSSEDSIKLWDLTNGKEIKTLSKFPGSTSSVRFSPDERFVIADFAHGTRYLWEVDSGTPVATMISSTDGEWITFTPDGYYISSPEGHSLVRFLAEGGLETYSFEQFKSIFNRPNIIRERLSGKSKAADSNPVVSLPPRIDLPDHLSFRNTETKTWLLKLSVSSSVDEVKSVRVFVNGKPVIEVPVNTKEKELALEVPLFPGANRITAVAYNGEGFSSAPKYVDVSCNRTDLSKPDLYALGIGISKYAKLPREWQLSYAHTDAEAVLESLAKQEGKLFGAVKTRLITNEEATPETIAEILQSLQAMNENDLAIIFLAGHGLMGEDGVFYFLTSAGNLEEPKNGGLDWKIFEESLSKIKGRVILLLDACHSGNISKET